jgi:hypothetical protein
MLPIPLGCGIFPTGIAPMPEDIVVFPAGTVLIPVLV